MAEFENLLVKTLQKARWHVKQSPRSADDATDIVAHQGKNVHVFRTLDDTRALLEKSRPARKVAVIGGGLLGLEAARGLQVQGCDVTVVHLADS